MTFSSLQVTWGVVAHCRGGLFARKVRSFLDEHGNPMANFSCLIFAKDVARLTSFYRDALNAVVAFEDASHSVLEVNGFELVIHGIPAEISNRIQIASPAVPRESTPIKPGLQVGSLETLRSVCDRHGASLSPEDAAWDSRGHRVLDGADPEGNIIQFRESLGG